jgi:hypothetical protein
MRAPGWRAGGTPAMRIDAASSSLGDGIVKAANSSDARAIAAILAVLPAAGAAMPSAPFQAGASLSAEQRGLLVRPPNASLSGMRKSCSDSIHRAWIASIILMLAMLFLTPLVPDIPLRSRNDPVTGAALGGVST